MRLNVIVLFLFPIFLGSCGSGPKSPEQTAADDAGKTVLYFNGDIITMEGDSANYVEALLVKDGVIRFAGSRVEAEKQAGGSPRLVDLKGKTLLPGFIDGHSHITKYADGLFQADFNPPPIGKVNNIPDIITALQELKKKLKASDTDWLAGNGYDQEMLAEKRHPTAADLDAAFPTNPVVLGHASGHMLVANSAALRKAGITAQTPDPPGGTIIRIKGGKEPEGLVQEMAQTVFFPFLLKPMPMDVEMKKIRDAQAYYASCGVTTGAEHLALPEKMALLDSAANRGDLFIDLTVLPAFIHAKEYVGTGKIKWAEYRNHLKYAGLKMAVDGSPQGKTAFLSKPYLTPVPGCSHDCKGFPNLAQDQVNELVLLCYRNNVQLFSHCNGDASIDMMIKGHEQAVKILGDSTTDRRTVIIHSQIMRPDQLSAYRRYRMFPSFFTNHAYYWGDAHVANLGMERAGFISPMRSAMNMGIRCSNHTDCTVTPMDQLFVLWTAVNRLSRSGVLIGGDERISPYQALRCMTIDAAYEYFEEKKKGSLANGKMADLVILDKNPLKIEVSKIKDIKVLETIKEGKSIYFRKD
jgi:hypothetical protein